MVSASLSDSVAWVSNEMISTPVSTRVSFVVFQDFETLESMRLLQFACSVGLACLINEAVVLPAQVAI